MISFYWNMAWDIEYIGNNDRVLQAYLGGIVGFIPDHLSKANGDLFAGGGACLQFVKIPISVKRKKVRHDQRNFACTTVRLQKTGFLLGFLLGPLFPTPLSSYIHLSSSASAPPPSAP